MQRTIQDGFLRPWDTPVCTCEPKFEDHEATFSLVGSNDPIAGATATFRSNGVTLELRRLDEHLQPNRAIPSDRPAVV